MKLGFLTACFQDRSLEDIATWAQEHGYEALEVAAWPQGTTKAFTATHIDAANFDGEDKERVRSLFERTGLELSSIAYYMNTLHPDPSERQAVLDHTNRCIDVAGALDCPTVGMFVGRNPNKSISENLREAEQLFPPLVEHAGELGVKLIVENCPMQGWDRDGFPAGNLAYSPELWEWMFSLGLYLNFDPSHLVWLGIDPVEAIRPYVDRIPHAHAKDMETFPDKRNRFGFNGQLIGRPRPGAVGWWRYRLPGLGEVDWTRYIDALYEGGFDGVLSVEHEDDLWLDSEEKVEAALENARVRLRPHLIR